jgi:hypothetical protein
MHCRERWRHSWTDVRLATPVTNVTDAGDRVEVTFTENGQERTEEFANAVITTTTGTCAADLPADLRVRARVLREHRVHLQRQLPYRAVGAAGESRDLHHVFAARAA